MAASQVEEEALLTDSTVQTSAGALQSVCTVLREEVRELKWAVLAVACFLTFGSYYIYDFPGSIGTGADGTIESYFGSHGVEYTQSMNQLLYSVYSWPNTVLAVAGGLLIDKYLGLRRAMLLFTSLVLGGSLLFFTGVRAVKFPLMLFGRVVFGLGGESLAVSQSTFVARWFKGRRGMALAFGITISFSRVGSSLNFLLSPVLAREWGVTQAVLMGSGACGVSLLSCALLVAADMYAVRTGYLKPEPHDATVETAVAVGEGEALAETAVAAESLHNRETPLTVAEDGTAVAHFTDLLQLPISFWLLCIVCVACYCAIFPFIGIGKNFFEVKYGYSGSRAAQYLSLFQLTSAFTSPVIGLVVDGVGCNTWWLIAASGAFLLVHLLFALTMLPAIAIVVFMGLSYSFLVSGLWPSVPMVVDAKIVGFSYGVMTAVQNIGLATFPVAVGKILDRYAPSQSDSSSSVEATSSLLGSSLYNSLSSSGFWSSTVSSLWGGSSASEHSAAHEAGLPGLDGYLATEGLFAGAAIVSLFASVALLVADRQELGLLSASRARRADIQSQDADQLQSLLDSTTLEN